MNEELAELMRATAGHFRLESGHHGDLWLELDTLFDRPARLAGLVSELADSVAASRPDVICGPLTGGAFVALRVAEILGVRFCYTERTTRPTPGDLYSAYYTLAGAPDVAGCRVAVVDDVVNVGSATRSTLAALRAGNAEPVAVGALLALGDTVHQLARQDGLAAAVVRRHDSVLWLPDDCPLCAAGIELTG